MYIHFKILYYDNLHWHTRCVFAHYRAREWIFIEAKQHASSLVLYMSFVEIIGKEVFFIRRNNNRNGQHNEGNWQLFCARNCWPSELSLHHSAIGYSRSPVKLIRKGRAYLTWLMSSNGIGNNSFRIFSFFRMDAIHIKEVVCGKKVRKHVLLFT